jgi:hypothetical protein
LKGPLAFLNHKINLVPVFFPVVIESAAFTKPRHVFQYLEENECFQQRLENELGAKIYLL